MKTLILALALLLVGACTKEEFVGSPRSEKFVASPIESYQNLTCANSSTVKPPVDILYVVDNSLSSTYIGPIVKDQIRQTVQSISQEFDYRVVVAPLFAVSGSLPVITNNATGIQHHNIVQLKDLTMFTNASGANLEPGFERSRQIITDNRSNGLFRDNAHTIIVIVSNGDENTMVQCEFNACVTDSTKVDQEFNAYLNLKNSLSAKQLRLFTLVPHSSCQNGWVQGIQYRNMSQRLATAQGISASDSYDLCSSNYNLYAGVNQSIRQVLVPHIYDKWLVSTNTNPSSFVIRSVHKINQQGVSTVIDSNRYSIISGTHNTKWGVLNTTTNQKVNQPNPPEFQTGSLIQLNNVNDYVVHPECLVVKTETPVETYGFVVVPTAPKPETLVIRINGANATGWIYRGYRENQNIKTSGTPLLRTGYFIEMNYSSGDQIEVFYTPAPI